MSMTLYAATKNDLLKQVSPIKPFDDFSMNMGAGSLYGILRDFWIDFDPEEYAFTCGIDLFIESGKAWKNRTGVARVDEDVQLVKAFIERGGGFVASSDPTIINYRHNRALELAIRGKEAGATHMAGA